MGRIKSIFIILILAVITLSFSFACNVLSENNRSTTIDTGKETDQSQGGILMSGSLGTKYERVSIPSVQITGEGADGPPSISADGRYVAFQSGSMKASGNSGGVFVRDLKRKITQLAGSAVYTNGTALGHNPSINSDGRYVAFESEYGFCCGWSTFYSPTGIWVSDTTNNSTVSAIVFLHQGGDSSYNPSISADGRFVAFATTARLTAYQSIDFRNVYVRDLQQGVYRLISFGGDHGPSDGHSDFPSISANGRYIVFESQAMNLCLGTPGAEHAQKVIVYDMTTGKNSALGTMANGGLVSSSREPSISADGRYIAFISQDPVLPWQDPGYMKGRLFIHDQQTKTTTMVNANYDTRTFKGGSINSSDSYGYPCISGNGRYVAFLIYKENTNTQDLVIHDLKNNTSKIIVRDESFSQLRNYKPSISDDGRYVAFLSGKKDLVQDDTNGEDDVFVYFNDVPSEVPLAPNIQTIKPPFEAPLNPSSPTNKPHTLETPLQHK